MKYLIEADYIALQNARIERDRLLRLLPRWFLTAVPRSSRLARVGGGLLRLTVVSRDRRFSHRSYVTPELVADRVALAQTIRKARNHSARTRAGLGL